MAITSTAPETTAPSPADDDPRRASRPTPRREVTSAASSPDRSSAGSSARSRSSRVPFAGAREHVITGSVLLAFAAAWVALAVLSRAVDRPAPALGVRARRVHGASPAPSVLVVAPTGNELGWVWPPVVLALAVWMIVRARRDLHSRTRGLDPVPGVRRAVAVVPSAAATRPTARPTDRTASRCPAGSSTSAATSSTSTAPAPAAPRSCSNPAWASRRPRWPGSPPTSPPPPGSASTTAPVAAGANPPDGPQDGVEVATDLHTLLERAGEHGPFVLAGHSAGGIYVLNFAHLYPEQVAGVVLLDSMHPEQYTKIAGWPAFYEMFRRASAVLPSLSRLGVGRAHVRLRLRRPARPGS